VAPAIWALAVHGDDLSLISVPRNNAFTLGYDGPKWDVTTATDWLAWRDEQNG
jgi:hypothetical protein